MQSPLPISSYCVCECPLRHPPRRKMFLKHQYLLILISIAPTCTDGTNFCSDDKAYSDIRMMDSSQSPLWEVLNESTGLVQLYYNVSRQPNENLTLSFIDAEQWTLELYQLLPTMNHTLAGIHIYQNCSINYTEHREAFSIFSKGTPYPYWCKLETKPNWGTVFISSPDCPKCNIKGKRHSTVHYKMCRSNTCKKYLENPYQICDRYNKLSQNTEVNCTVESVGDEKPTGVKTGLCSSSKHRNTALTTTIYGDALKNNCNNPAINLSCVQIEVYHFKFKIHYHIAERRTNYCQHRGSGNEISMTEVHWDNVNQSLEFKLNHLRPGNFKGFRVRAFDTRCKRYSVWNWNTSGETCLWKTPPLNITAYHEEVSRAEPPDTHEMEKTQLAVALIVAIMITLLIFVVVMIFLSFKPLRNLRAVQPNSLRRNSVELPHATLPPSSILLLYARDCSIFMETMNQFRLLLRRTTNATIYDIWEEERREELDTQGDTWALNYLISERTQVIVVVTPVSRRIEKLILQNLWTSHESLYKEPNSLDEVFVSAFRTSIGLTSTHRDRCRKFIVVRMSSIDCSENLLTSFAQTLCTIYTLPSLLDNLFIHLFDGHWDPKTLPTSDRDDFGKRIKEFEEYIKQNPTYEENMVPIKDVKEITR